MKKVCFLFIMFILALSCEKEEISPAINGKLKTAIFFSSESDDTPGFFTRYYYDRNGNLTKDLTSAHSDSPLSSNVYKYSDDGRLQSKKHLAIQGDVHPGQTEADFSLIYELRYEYAGSNKIEKCFRNSDMTDSSVYTFDGNLILNEYHHDMDLGSWSIFYEYDDNKNLVKRTEYPEGDYTVYYYENSKLQSTLHYTISNNYVSETTYTYIVSGNKEVLEIRSRGFLKEKHTFRNGKIIERVRYSNLLTGSCVRYYYY